MPGTKGSGGRNAKGTGLHVLAGSFRADRHGAKKTPDAPKGKPEPPKPLEGDARDEWDRLVVRMEQLGTLSPVHDAAMYQYCHLFAETEELKQEREESKASLRIMEENIGDIEASDRVAMFQEIGKLRHDIKGYGASIRQNRMALRQYLVEFGLTPSALSRVSSGKGPALDDEEEALAKLLAVQ